MEGSVNRKPSPHSIICVETDILSILPDGPVKPLAVRWGQHIVGCNQIARKLGVQEGMVVAAAVSSCPGLVLHTVDQIPECSRIADNVTSILRNFTSIVDRATLDQSFIQLHSSFSKLDDSDDNDLTEVIHKLAIDLQLALTRNLQVAVRIGIGESKAEARAAVSSERQTHENVKILHKSKLPRLLIHDEQVIPWDRWRSILVDVHIRERIRTLVVRLVAMAEEDNRIPTAIKLSIRRVDPTKCTSWKDTRTGPVSLNLKRGADAVVTLVEVAMVLLHRMVDFQHGFQLTLLGLAFVRFEENHGKRSIASCILRKREMSVQMLVNVVHEGKGPVPASPSSAAPHASRELDESSTPCEKRAKLDIIIKKRKLREREMEISSPSKLRVADLTLNCDEGTTRS